jgi:OHCU decarboxylase
MIGLAELNALPADAFVATLGGIFEHSPWVAARVADQRPFDSVLALTARLRAAVAVAAPAEQLALIRAHPKLGARGAQLATLTGASQGEQRRAGLAACSDEEYAELLALNGHYVERFDFPFILAVRGHAPASIIASCRSRLGHTVDEERRTALTQIGLIAGFRLADTVSSDPVVEARAMFAALQAAGADPASLLHEWMLGAHLEVATDPAGWPIGTLPVAAGAAARVGGPVRLRSAAACVVGIAVVRDLRHRAQAATRALVLGPPGDQADTDAWAAAELPDRVQYLHSQLTSSGTATDEH